MTYSSIHGSNKVNILKLKAKTARGKLIWNKKETKLYLKALLTGWISDKRISCMFVKWTLKLSSKKQMQT